MDAFKLLSRSTNLRAKKNAGLTPTKQQLPSNGVATDPRIYGRDEPLASTHAKKRKRTSSAEDKQNDVTDDMSELDFFGDASSSKTKKARNESATLPDSSSALDPNTSLDGDNESAEDTLNDEERRRILRAHKIKATTLWEQAAEENSELNGAKAHKKKKRKETTAVPELSKKEKRKRAELTPLPLERFSQLRTRYGVNRRICENLEQQAYDVPTEVQMGGLPLLLEHDGPQVDLLSVAPTGSGKTLAFLIPVLNAVKRVKSRDKTEQRQRAVRAVILAPTKELASQITNEGRKLAMNTGVQVTMLRKGMKLGEQTTETDEAETAQNKDEISEGEDEDEEDGDDQPKTQKPKAEMFVKADIVVSTPLTMVHALATSTKSSGNLPSASYLVLDEADVLLDPLFRDQTLAIWNACSNPHLRVSLWSATMGASIEELAMSHITQRWASVPQAQREGAQRVPLVRLVIGLKDSAIPNIHHKLVYAASEQGKLMGLRQLLRGDSAPTKDKGTEATPTPVLRPPFLVFTQTIARAVALHAELLYDIPPEAGGSSRIAVLHSDLSDTARDMVMTRFRKGEIWVLITTDLLSRGVDFRGVNGVVNYDFPSSSAAYIHRVGRTGRAGRQGGVAVTLYAKDDIPYVKNVANVIAASEKLRKGEHSDGMSQWLLNMLPQVSKRDKQQLKKRGVESRRTGKEDAKTRISTKSGYERKMEARKKGAVKGSQRRARAEAVVPVDTASDDGFDGFD